MFNNNKEFMKRALPMLIVCVFLFYFNTGLYNDQLNFLNPYFQAKGWTATQITLPFTIGAYIVIILWPIAGKLMEKFGIIKITVPSFIIVGLCALIMGMNEGNMTVYFITMLILRCVVTFMQTGAYLLCSNWFVYGRGRALGIVTAGAPLGTATLISYLTYAVPAWGMKKTYLLIFIAIVILALLLVALIKDTPEQLGMYPDGYLTPPKKEDEDESITLKELFSNKMVWPLILSHGFLWMMIGAVMAFYSTQMTLRGVAPELYLPWLSVGAILGIPMSFILGWIDDKIGTPRANIVHIFFGVLLPLTTLLFMPEHSVPMLLLSAFGVACLTGGTGTIQPSTCAFVYGRRRFNAANKWILCFQMIIGACGLPFMSAIMDKTGSLSLAYIILIIGSVICIFLFLYMDRFPDHDRGFMGKRAYRNEELGLGKADKE